MSLGDAIAEIVDARVRTSVARAAAGLAGATIDDVPGKPVYEWSWTPPGNPGRNPYPDHFALEGASSETGEFGGQHIGDHRGCQCVVAIESVTVRISASQATPAGATIRVHYAVGAEAGPFAQRYRATAKVLGGPSIGDLVPGFTDKAEERAAADRGRYVRTAAELIRSAF